MPKVSEITKNFKNGSLDCLSFLLANAPPEFRVGTTVLTDF